ncbi:hypothetical protein PIB30_029788 [Stylosanthes scabra]|uniref:Uncharacterized protein n=1 Tax=Stylosanthes scabra TaxID=79078 RepID=A0ABU6SBN1_9FABA|nr:hypothetical protein [Stylosanthes scabra]
MGLRNDGEKTEEWWTPGQSCDTEKSGGEERAWERHLSVQRPPEAELTASLSPPHTSPRLCRQPCAVALVPSALCRHPRRRHSLPLQNRSSPPLLSPTSDPELPEADSVSTLDLKLADVPSTPDLKLANMPSTPDTKLAVTLVCSRHRSSSSPSPSQARRSSYCLSTSRTWSCLLEVDLWPWEKYLKLKTLKILKSVVEIDGERGTWGARMGEKIPPRRGMGNPLVSSRPLNGAQICDGLVLDLSNLGTPNSLANNKFLNGDLIRDRLVFDLPD